MKPLCLVCLLTVLPAGIYDVLYFPSFGGVDELERVGTAMVQLVIEVELVRGPHAGQGLLCFYAFEPDALVKFVLRGAAHQLYKFGKRLCDDPHLPGLVGHVGLQHHGTGTGAFEQHGIAFFHTLEEVVDHGFDGSVGFLIGSVLGAQWQAGTQQQGNDQMNTHRKERVG